MEKECYLCKTIIGLHKHHVFGGPNRKNSEKYGMTCYLCPYHHNMSNEAVHFNKHLDIRLKKEFQQKFEFKHGHEKFMEVFGRNYL